MGMIKDMTTRHEATIRRAYERSHQRHDVRTSFIASANVDDILRNHTGSRRFIILDMESIERNYPISESSQILAQFQSLSQIPYRMAPLSEETIKAYMKEQTPDDPDEAILAEFDMRMKNYEEGQNKTEFTYGEICEGIAQIARNHGYRNPRYLQSLLKRTKRAMNRNGQMRYSRLHSA
jgi:predicted P-loop ATPase